MPIKNENQIFLKKTDIRKSFSYNTLTIIFGAIAALLGAIGVIGLSFGIVFLSGILPEFKPIAVSAALAWIFFGLILAFHAKKPLTGITLTIIKAVSLVIVVTAVLGLLLNLGGWNFFVEDLINSIASQFMSGQVTPISPVATVFIILSGIALFLALGPSRNLPENQRSRNVAGIVGFSIVLISFTFLLSYSLGAPLLYKTTIIPIALSSALAALFTGLGLVTTAGPSSLPLRYLTAHSIRARLLWSFLPLIVIIVLAQGLLQTTFVSVYHVDNAIEISIGIMLFCLITAYIVNNIAGEVGRQIETEEEKRRNAEEALRESEETFRALAENANDGILVAVGNGVHVFANRRAAEITGYRIDELLKLTIRDLSHPDEFRRKIHERYVRKLAGETELSEYETRIVRKDGKILPIEITSAKTDWKSQAADLVLIRDISARKQAEETLRESEQRLLLALDVSLMGIWELDLELRTAHRTLRHDQIFGYETLLPEWTYEIFRMHVIPEDRKDVDEKFNEAIAKQHFWSFECRIRRSDDVVRWIFAVGKGEYDPNGKPVRMLGIVQDITDRKQVEQQREILIKDLEQKNAELERFTYTVSHDLRSPLITIHGFTGLLESDIAGNNATAIAHDLDRINTAATKMEELLHDLLNLSRIGRIVNPPEKVSFTVIAEGAVDLLEGAISEKKVQIIVDPDMPDVTVDQTRVREAVMNLVENAVKFIGDQQHPEIRIGFEYAKKQPVFFVRDNGIGIDPKYFGKLFNLFEKLDAKKEGSGVGLAIVRRIIEVQGGRIWVESGGPGKGTTFLFTLPVL